MLMMQNIEIRAFGPMQLIMGGNVQAFGQRRVRRPLELLRALVAAGPDGASRDELCQYLWGMPVQVAYRSLVTTVFRLRRLLDDPQAVIFTDRRVVLAVTRCWVDAWQFESVLQAPVHLSPTTVAALALYRGALFEGQFAPQFEQPRERLRRLFVSATLATGSELVAEGSLASAQLHYEKALQFECGSEELFRALIEVQGKRGRGAAAAIVYNSCAVAMRRYYGRLPSAETQAAWMTATGSSWPPEATPLQSCQLLAEGAAKLC